MPVEPSVPILAYGTQPWDPMWSELPPYQADAVALTGPQRVAAWREALGGRLADGVDPAAATAHFMLGAPAIRRAAEAAALLASARGEQVSESHLRAGARGQNAAGLARLARRIEPEVSWPDLVLPEHVLAQLHELAGGHIRSGAITAAYLAAEAGRPVGMAELVGAVGREYRKLGRLTLESEFGQYLSLAG